MFFLLLFNFTDSFFVGFFHTHAELQTSALTLGVSLTQVMHQNALFGPSMFLLLFNFTNSFFLFTDSVTSG